MPLKPSLYLRGFLSGGGGGGGEEKPHEGHPSKQGFWTPLRLIRFPTPPLGVIALYKSPRRRSFGGVQEFSGGRVLLYVLLPPYVLLDSAKT